MSRWQIVQENGAHVLYVDQAPCAKIIEHYKVPAVQWTVYGPQDADKALALVEGLRHLAVLLGRKMGQQAAAQTKAANLETEKENHGIIEKQPRSEGPIAASRTESLRQGSKSSRQSVQRSGKIRSIRLGGR